MPSVSLGILPLGSGQRRVPVADSVRHGGVERKVNVANHDRTTALSAQLARTHQILRDQLRVLRRRLMTGDRPAGGLSRDLREHCVGFCAALQNHHTAEDEGLLPALRRERPELGPTIDKLVEDHQLIAWILQRIADLLAQSDGGPDPGSIVGEIDGLAAIMESHFAYEERRISSAVDALQSARIDVGADRWSIAGPT
jgi:Hemerythrin HHE cation binding domain